MALHANTKAKLVKSQLLLSDPLHRYNQRKIVEDPETPRHPPLNIFSIEAQAIHLRKGKKLPYMLT